MPPRKKLTWHFVCTSCADEAHVARYYRIDGTRRTGKVCCYCLVNEPAPGLEGQGRQMNTCRC